MTEKLKPCPFCGGEAEVYENEYENITLFMVACKNCGISTAGYDYEEDAIKDWNRRAGE